MIGSVLTSASSPTWTQQGYVRGLPKNFPGNYVQPSPVERHFPELTFLALSSLLAGRTSTFTLLMNQCARFLPFPGKGVQHPPLLNELSMHRQNASTFLDAQGGGLDISGGTVALQDCTISDNQAYMVSFLETTFNPPLLNEPSMH